MLFEAQPDRVQAATCASSLISGFHKSAREHQLPDGRATDFTL